MCDIHVATARPFHPYCGVSILALNLTTAPLPFSPHPTPPGDVIIGLDSWYTGYSNSNYAKTNTEYTGTNGQVGATITHKGHYVDTASTAGVDGDTGSLVLNEGGWVVGSG